jgi:Ni/Co efflux regulator RcnB
MLKKVLVTAAFALQVAALPLAQAAAPAPAQAVPTNTHKANQDKVRACRKEAAAKQLTGEEFRAFIAQCVKAEPAPK